VPEPRVYSNLPLLIIALLTVARLTAAEASPIGLWRTVDDKTQEPRGLVRIFEKDGALFGAIEKSFDPKEAGERCSKCEGDRKDKPVIGMIILRGMKKRGPGYGDGDILDPDTGTVYRCRMSIEDGGKRLIVRGFIGIALLGRSQTWWREE
jgi:uncharacterized protein (DUF2147 family)